MILYAFEIQDTDEKVEKFFPMGECPNEIELQDGRKAVRRLGCPNITFGNGVLPLSQADRRRKMMTQKNIDSGKKGEQKWRSKMPKLVKQ